MSRHIPHCVRAYREAVGFGEHNGHPRSFKRFLRKQGMSDPLEAAYNWGQASSSVDTPPYPAHAKARISEWRRGQESAR